MTKSNRHSVEADVFYDARSRESRPDSSPVRAETFVPARVGSEKLQPFPYDAEPLAPHITEPPPQYERHNSEVSLKQKFYLKQSLLGSSIHVCTSERSTSYFNPIRGSDYSGFKNEDLPILFTTSSPLSTKYLTIRRTSQPPEGVKYTKDAHSKDFCYVKKHTSLKCNIFVLDFVDSKQTVTVIYHKVLPIIDYEVNGIVYRWRNTSIFHESSYRYIVFRLPVHRGYSLIDSLEKGKSLKKDDNLNQVSLLTISDRVVDENIFLGATNLGFLEEIRAPFSAALFEVSEETLEDTKMQKESKNEEKGGDSAIEKAGTNNDEYYLVHLCVGLVIKRYEDNSEQRRQFLKSLR